MVETLLVATDGSAATWGAIRLAATLARERQALVEVLCVVEPLTRAAGFVPPDLPHFDEVERLRAADVQRRVLELVEGIFHEDSRWNLSVLTGPVASTIATRALEVGAGLVVVGRRTRPGRVQPVVSTAMEVLALSGLPVLAATRDVNGLPRSALAAVDFGAASLRAVRTAGDLIASRGKLRLLHVIPPLDFPAAVLWGWNESLARLAPGAFEEFRESLGTLGDLELCTEIARADPAAELLSEAREQRVDLLVAGTHGPLYSNRVLLGSVASRILREATTSVLLSPAGSGSVASAPSLSASRAAGV